ncbi:MAG TPA: thiamine diphosphokinase [Treponemataceae bacterium]|nr:thiamine diphosphokinase [Treponemataceae bacterium]
MMRGLIFTGGKGPDMGTASRLFAQRDFVIAADSGLSGSLEARIVPDLVIGDMDSLEDQSLLDAIPEGNIRRWPRDKDYTDTELALAEMRRRGIDRVTLVGGCGGRLDHLFALKALYESGLHPVVWIGEESVVLAVDGTEKNEELRVAGLSSEDPVSFFPAGKTPHVATAAGLHWNVDSLDWDGGAYSLSNRCPEGSFVFTAECGLFLAIVPLSGSLTFKYPEAP